MSVFAERLRRLFGQGVPGLLGLLALTMVAFGLASPQFLTAANFISIAFQLPDLGLLTLAMLGPIMSGGINLAVIATANHSGLTLAWILNTNGGPQAGVFSFVVGVGAALAVGGASGAAMGATIAYFGAHPILASLAMMIFLRGLGEFLTRGGDISGFPAFLGELGHGVIAGVPVPMLVFIAAAILWHVLLARTRHGFSVAMIGSNPQASEYSGIPVRRSLTLVYALSGVMCAFAGIVMLTRFNSVRVGHGEALLLRDCARVLSWRRRSVRRIWPCRAGVRVAAHPADAFFRPQFAWRQSASLYCGLGPVPGRRDGLAICVADAAGAVRKCQEVDPMRPSAARARTLPLCLPRRLDMFSLGQNGFCAGAPLARCLPTRQPLLLGAAG